ncbi:MAG TPA: RDD family protein [Methanocella sp.]|nr:RDD family protein [Methanocella sp.]
MDFSDEAKREIEKNLGETARNISVDEKERTEIMNELRSTYYESAMKEARSRGSETVTLTDARTAKASVSSPRETADCFMKSYATGLKRAGFWWRLAAFLIDSTILCMLIFLIMSPILGFMFFTGMPINDDAAHEAWFNSQSPTIEVLFIATVFTVLPSFLIIILGYYFVIEGHFGQTPGKYLLRLRVLRTDGTKIGYKEAILRNLSKYNNYLIIFDVLIMLIFFPKEKQRGFDRIANTIVVHSKA